MTRLVDDIDGSHAVTTLSFGLDGRSYEIDLSESHLSAFRQALAPFITAARALPGGRTPTAVPAPEPARAPAPAAAPAARAAAPAAPAPKQRVTPASAGNAAVVEEEIPARPSVDAQPFQPPSPAPEPAAPARPKPAPLVADPFNPRS